MSLPGDKRLEVIRLVHILASDSFVLKGNKFSKDEDIRFEYHHSPQIIRTTLGTSEFIEAWKTGEARINTRIRAVLGDFQRSCLTRT